MTYFRAQRRPWPHRRAANDNSRPMSMLQVIAFAGIVVMLLVIGRAHGHGAELALPRHGQLRVIDGDISRFGTYSPEYYARRWRRMCAGSARYEAMREANDRGRPNPC